MSRISFLVASALASVACNSQTQVEQIDPPYRNSSGPILRVTSPHPTPGTTLGVSSTRLFKGTAMQGLLITFSNGVTVRPDGVDGNTLTLNVPDGAQGPAMHVNDGVISERADLMVRYPQGTVDALRVTPELARPGDVVTVVTGNQKHAGISDDEELRVRIDGIEVPAEPVDLAHVKFTLPAMEVGEHRLVIVTRAGSAGSARVVVASR